MRNNLKKNNREITRTSKEDRQEVVGFADGLPLGLLYALEERQQIDCGHLHMTLQVGDNLRRPLLRHDSWNPSSSSCGFDGRPYEDRRFR